METRQLTPRESAQHMARILQEDVAAIPTFATPKYPMSVIMHTERHIAIMMDFAREGSCDEQCLGITQHDIKCILGKARVLRARLLVRKLKRDEGVYEDARTLADLIADGFVTLSDIRMEEADFAHVLQMGAI